MGGVKPDLSSRNTAEGAKKAVGKLQGDNSALSRRFYPHTRVGVARSTSQGAHLIP